MLFNRNKLKYVLLLLLKPYLSITYTLILGCVFNVYANSDVKIFGKSQGVSDNSINHIIQDSNDFIWFATTNGVTRYDASSFKIYNPLNKKLKEEYIIFLIEDSLRNIWAGSSNGLFIYNSKKDIFDKISFFKSKHLDEIHIYSICMKNKYTLLIGARNGLYEYNIKSKQIKKVLFSQNELNNQAIRVLKLFGNKLYIGFEDKGLIKYDLNNSKITRFSEIDQSIRAIEIDRIGNIWVGSYEKGLFIIDNKKNTISNIKLNTVNSINQIVSNFDYVFIATEGNGVYKMDINTRKIIHVFDEKNSAISNNKIWSFYIDNQKNYWFGHYLGGITYLPSLQNQYETISLANQQTAIIRDLLIVADNTLLIANDEGGLLEYNLTTKKLNKKVNVSVSSDIHSLDAVQIVFEDLKGRIWIGRYNNSILIYHPALKKVESFNSYFNNSYRFPVNDIRDFAEDVDGNIWIATHGGGFVKFNDNQNIFKVYSSKTNRLIPDWIKKIEVDSRGQVWCTSNKKIIRFNPTGEKIKQYTLPNLDFSQHEIYSLIKDNNNVIWVGTSDGLFVFDSKKDIFNAVKPKYYDSFKNSNALLSDDNSLIICTNNAVLKYFPNTNTVQKLVLFSKKDNVNQYLNSLCIDKNKNIYIGTNSGIVYFHPDKIHINKKAPSLQFINLYIHDEICIPSSTGSPLKQIISESKEIVLDYNQSSFKIEFSALNFNNSEWNKYRCKLEGYDLEWRFLDDINYVSYTNIPSGKYTFKVMASNNYGIWNEKGISIVIVVLPPFWLTWWFLSLVICFILFCFFSIYFYVKYVNKKRKLILELLEKKSTLGINSIISKPIDSLSINAENVFIEKIYELINKHMKDSDFSVDQLSQKVFMSRTQLYRKVKTTTGYSPQELIDVIRLNMAKKILIESNLNVSEVAYEVGYSNPLYFSRRFKHYFKVAPSIFLKNNRVK